MKQTIEDLNEMDEESFVEEVGWIFEHSPWVARRAWMNRPFSTLNDLHGKMVDVVKKAGREEKLKLLRAHPDLGTKADVAPASKKEQSGAGLDELSDEEYVEFVQLNNAYTEKYGIPFIMAVKGQDKRAIQRSMADRVVNDREEERERALQEVYKIARFRLEDYFKKQGDY